MFDLSLMFGSNPSVFHTSILLLRSHRAQSIHLWIDRHLEVMARVVLWVHWSLCICRLLFQDLKLGQTWIGGRSLHSWHHLCYIHSFRWNLPGPLGNWGIGFDNCLLFDCIQHLFRYMCAWDWDWSSMSLLSSSSRLLVLPSFCLNGLYLFK